MSINREVVEDPFFERVKKAKDVRAVQKHKFASFASSVPKEVSIFSFEGPDDRIIYHSWISKLSTDMRYEAYQCNGKRQVLQLFDLLSEDRTGLARRVYYFVDHDFDGLQGRPESDRIFLTDRYAIENYIVCEHLLDDLLNVNFHCNGLIDIRKFIIKKFLDLYEVFLQEMQDINFRIFLARVYGIEAEDLPNSLHEILKINIDSVGKTEKPTHDVIQLKREPTEQEINEGRTKFSCLQPRHHYRGKFCLSFFTRWLSLLRSDRLSESPTLFKDVPPPSNNVHGDFSFSYLASKARPPVNLSSFLSRI